MCAGWRAMADAFPETSDTAEAMEGTAAHWVIEQIMSKKPVADGDIAPNGVEVTEEMLDGAELFINAVGTTIGHVEKRVDMRTIINPANWGTPDFFGLDTGVLRIIDYKFGHRYVEEFENWQIIDYAAGICEFLEIRPAHGLAVEITIVQPRHFGRHGPVRTWKTSYGELVPYWEKLRAAAAAAMEPEPLCTVGSQCEFCPGRHACETLQRATLNIVDQSFTSLPLILPNDVAARELKTMLRSAKLLESRITGLSESLLMALTAGQTVPGLAAERSEGRQKWNKPIPEVIATATLLGIDVSKPALITPKQAIKKGMSAGVVNSISEVPIGELKLVEVDLRKSRKVFGENN